MARLKILKVKYMILLTQVLLFVLILKLIKGEKANNTNLVTTAALNIIENKIPDHSKYIIISESKK